MPIRQFIIERMDILAAKLTVLTVLSIVPAGGFSFLQNLTGWYVENAFFMSFVSVAIFIDHAVGSWVHWKIKKDFSWQKNRNGLFMKILGSIAGYVIFEMFYQIVDDVDFIAVYLKVLLQVVTFAYPGFSALMNISIATGGKYPSKGIMGKFIKFEETADLKIFKTKIDETETDSNNDSGGDSDTGLPQ